MSYDFKYADLLDDEVFKLVFGRESTKDVMIEFLNQVILDRRIVDLQFIDKEMHPVERDSKGSVYDFKAYRRLILSAGKEVERIKEV